MVFDVFEEAGYALYDILNGIKIEGRIHVNVEGCVIIVESIYFKNLGLSALYVNLDLSTKYLQKPQLLRISRIQYGPDLFPYGLLKEVDVLRSVFYITRQSLKRDNSKDIYNYPAIMRWMKGDILLPISKMSSSHLRHITTKEMAILGYDWFDRRVNFILPTIEKMIVNRCNEAFIIGLLLWAKSITDINREYISRSSIWDFDIHDEYSFLKIIKERLTLKMKAVQNIVSMDLTQFFELEVLVNRGIGDIDWKAEERNRTIPNLANFDEQQVLTEAKRLFMRCKMRGSLPEAKSWQKYWRARWQWAPTGSYHSQYSEDGEYRSKDVMNRHKLYSLCRMGTRNFEHFYNRKPETVAWTSTKYEWGKMRAIYGVDITNFIMTGYAMGDCEKVLSEIFPIGPSATESNVKTTIKEILRNGIPFCFDYEDFNSQHSVGSMAAVLQAYHDVFVDCMSEEQSRAMGWIKQSVTECHVLRADGSSYRTRGTLLSGWRLTTFMNTVLNSVYTSIMLKDIGMITTHNGDDIFGAVDNIKQVQILNKEARKHNVRFQQNKCFLGAIAEFLRIDHLSSSGGQYLSRSIATLVHGPAEMSIPNDLLALLTAIRVRAQEAIDRGADKQVIEDIENVQIAYLEHKWGLTVNDYNTIKRTHVSKGGFSEEISTDSLSHSIEIRRVQAISKTEKILKNVKIDENSALPGVFDYAKDITDELRIPEYRHEIVKRAKRTVLGRSLANRYSISILKVPPDKNDFVKASRYGMYRGIVGMSKLSLARAFKIPILALGTINKTVENIIHNEEDKLEAINLLF